MSKRQCAALLVGLGLFVGCWWRFLPHGIREREQLIWPMVLGIMAAGFLLRLRARPARLRPMIFLLLAMFVANAGLIVYDCAIDPTDHNLFPLEFAILGICCLPGFLSEWFAGRFDLQPPTRSAAPAVLVTDGR